MVVILGVCFAIAAEKIMSHQSHIIEKQVNFFASDLCTLSPHLKSLSAKRGQMFFWNNLDDPKL